MIKKMETVWNDFKELHEDFFERFVKRVSKNLLQKRFKAMCLS